jgi:integrase
MNAPIFQAPRGGYIRHSNFNRRIFRPALAALGINNFTFHSLRHTAISHAIASGADVIAVSKIAGHANPAITLNVYGHLLNNSLENFRNAIDVNFALASSN